MNLATLVRLLQKPAGTNFSSKIGHISSRLLGGDVNEIWNLEAFSQDLYQVLQVIERFRITLLVESYKF